VSCAHPHILVGANGAGPNCCHWGRNDLVALGAHNSVILYDPKKYKILHTLPGHTARVNVVRWINALDRANTTTPAFLPESELISGASDKQLILWKRVKSAEQEEWVQSAVLKQNDSITSLSSLTYPSTSDPSDVLVASAEASCKVLLWKRNVRKPEQSSTNNSNNNATNTEDKEWQLAQTLNFAPKMIESVSLTFMFASSVPVPLLAAAGVDTLIHIFIEVKG